MKSYTDPAAGMALDGQITGDVSDNYHERGSKLLGLGRSQSQFSQSVGSDIRVVKISDKVH